MVFDYDYLKNKQLKEVYADADALATDFKAVDDNASDGFIDYVSYVLFDYYSTDLIAYDEEDRFKHRLKSTLYQVRPLIEKKLSYFTSLVDENTTKEEFVSTGGMASTRKAELEVDGESFQRTANTPTKITPSATEDFVDTYTNYQGKVDTHNTSTEDGEAEIKRYGSTKDLFKLLETLPLSLYDEVCALFSQHFIYLY